jgi:hypothetical protein
VFGLILLGHAQFWKTPEFKALSEGFNVGIQSVRFAEVSHFTASLSSLYSMPRQTIRSLKVLPFLVSIYDRRVKAIEDVSEHLSFQIVTRDSNLTTPYFIKLFEIRLQHYLLGVGHPPQLYNVQITQEELEDSQHNPLLRANLILQCGSDSNMLPMLEDWVIAVCSSLLTRLLPYADCAISF